MDFRELIIFLALAIICSATFGTCLTHHHARGAVIATLFVRGGVHYFNSTAEWSCSTRS
jgi:hypothetical protein